MKSGKDTKSISSLPSAAFSISRRITGGLFACLLLMTIGVPSSFAETGVDREYKIKAGFLYKFLFFASWPDKRFLESEDTIIIGILGDDPFGELFAPVEGQVIDGKTLVIKRFSSATSGDRLRECHLLFTSNPARDLWKRYRKLLKGHPVLTVSESDGFIEQGGMIRFVTKQNRVTFEINKTAAMHVGIRLRSRLLRLATRVIKD